MVAPSRPLTFGWVAERNARRTPQRPALVHADRRFTWEEFEEETAAVATGLLQAGLAPGDPVALLLGNGVVPVTAVWALARAGLPIVSLHPSITPTDAAPLLRDARCVAAITDDEHVGVLSTALDVDSSVRRRWIAGERRDGYDPFDGLARVPRDVLPAAEERDVLRLQYTSGTTGRPKGAVQTHRSQVLLMLLIAVECAMRPDERGLIATTLTSHGGFVQSSVPMWLGGTLVLHDRFDPGAVLRDIAAERVTSTFMVPTMFNALTTTLEAGPGEFDLSSLRTVMTGSAPRAAAVRDAMDRHFPAAEIYELYGSTECGMATVLKPRDAERKVGSVGQAAVGSEVEIRDRDGQRVAAGEHGDIWVRTLCLAEGYHGMPAATSEAFVDGWHRTGDLGWLDEDGFLHLLDRRVDLIITGGMNVYPAEVEAALYEHADVLEAAVVGISDERWGQEVVAAVVPKSGREPDEEELRRFARERLAGYKAPKRVVIRSRLPKNAAGKIRRGEVRKLLTKDGT